jgi:hypothetical protein
MPANVESAIERGDTSCWSGSNYWKKTPLHFGQCLLAGALVVCAVGFTRPRHKRLDYLYLLWRVRSDAALAGIDYF